jgi:hypothetical protein
MEVKFFCSTIKEYLHFNQTYFAFEKATLETKYAFSPDQKNYFPYKGNAPAMVDVMGGKVTFMFDITSTGRAFIESGKARGLAVKSKQRNPSLPNIPTMIEAGGYLLDKGDAKALSATIDRDYKMWEGVMTKGNIYPN